MPKRGKVATALGSGLKTAWEAASPTVSKIKDIVNNILFPTSVPGFSDVVEMYRKGKLSKNDVYKVCQMLGIPIFEKRGAGPTAGIEKVWEALFDTSGTLPDADMVWAKALMSYRTDTKVWQRYLLRTGADPLWWNLVSDIVGEYPGISEAQDMFARKLITPDDYDLWMRRSGALPSDWFRMLSASYEWPDTTLLAEGVRRGHISPEDFTDLLTANGTPTAIFQSEDGLLLPFARSVGDKQILDVQELLKEMVYYLPSPGDLVTFGVKDVFDPITANLFGLFNDYPKLIEPWAKKLGMTEPIGIRANVDGVPTDLHWMHLQWGAHWRNLGAGQFFEFLHRIRPDNIAKLKARGFFVEPFTMELVRRGLKTDDYSPAFRDYLTAVSYRPIEARRVQQGLFHGVMARKDAEEAWMDRGYHPDDAQKMTDVAIAQNDYIKDAPRRQLIRHQLSAALSEVLASYETGTISRETAVSNTTLILFDKAAAENQVKIVDSKLLRSIAAQALKSIRSDWMQGTLSLAELQLSLSQAGIATDRASHYVQLWTLERSHRRRAASSGQILGWVAKGLMAEPEASRRLANLGWYGPDVAVMLADSQHKLAQLQAREEQQVATSAAKQARALAKMQKETQALQKQLQSRLRMSEPVSRLVKWLKAGIIDVPQFRARMQAIGILPAMVNQYVAETLKEMEQEATKAEESALRKSQSAVHHAPVSTLRKWFKLGIISEDQFRSMAAAIKTSQSDIDNYIAQTNMGK